MTTSPRSTPPVRVSAGAADRDRPVELLGEFGLDDLADVVRQRPRPEKHEDCCGDECEYHENGQQSSESAHNGLGAQLLCTAGCVRTDQLSGVVRTANERAAHHIAEAHRPRRICICLKAGRRAHIPRPADGSASAGGTVRP